MEHPTIYVSLQGFNFNHYSLVHIDIKMILQLQKQEVDNWTHASPLCCHFEVFAVEGPTTASYLEYYLPVKGIIPQDITLLIHRRLQTTGYS